MQKVTDPALLAELNGGGASSPVPSVAPTQQPAPAPIAAPRGRPGIIFPATPKAPDPYRVQQDAFNNDLAARRVALAEEAAAREREKAERERTQLTPAKRFELESSQNKLNSLERGIREISAIYKESFKGRNPLEYLPAPIRPSSGELNDASRRLPAFIANALGLTGQQFNTPAEQSLFIGSYLPSNTDTDEQIERKINALTDLLANARKGLAAQMGQAPSTPSHQPGQSDEDGAVPPPQAETSKDGTPPSPSPRIPGATMDNITFDIDTGTGAFGSETTGQRLSPADEREYAAFQQANARIMTPAMLNAWWEAKGFGPLANADEVAKANRAGQIVGSVDYHKVDEAARAKADAAAAERYGDDYGSRASSFIKGVSQGWSDELTGVGGAVGNLLRGENPIEGYQRERDIARAVQRRSREDYGLGYEIAGSLALPLGWMKAPKTVGQFAAQGGKIGAFAGAGEGEGLPGTIGGAAIGGGIGAGGGAVIGKAAPYAEPLVANVANRMRGAADRISGRAAKEARAERAWELGEAGARQDVPIRRADIDPTNLAHKRGVAKTTEKGNSIIRQADADDLAAVEAATLKLGDGSAARDAFEHGARAQAVLTRRGKHTKDEARRLYGIAEELTDGTRFAPRQAVATLNDEITRLEGEGADAALITYLRRQEALLRRPEGWTPMQLHAFRAKLRSNLNTAGVPVEAGELPMIRAIDAASGDLQRALQEADPRALQAVQRADAIWKERADFRREVGDKLFGRKGDFSPDQTARAFDAMARTDSQRLARFVRDMTPDEAADLRATYAAQLGRDRQGNFSLAHFLTQTEGKGALATPRSMKLLLGDDGMRAIADLRIIAKAKQAAASETNHSKTGNAVSTVGRGLRTLLFAGIGNAAGGPAGAVVAPAASNWFSGIAAARAARLVTNPDFTRWLKYAPQTNNPAVIDRYFDKLNKIAARDSVFLMDAQALQDYLRRQFSEGVGRAAATGEQGEDDGRE